MLDVDYDFFTTDESFDYPTGYGYATCYQKAVHGITITYGDNDNIIKWCGYGHFAVDLKSIKTFDDLKKYILNHIGEVQYEEDEEKLLELVERLGNPQRGA